MKKLDLNQVRHGVVCFTFDDQNFPGWLDALPLLEQYRAHVSFFVSGELTEAALSAMTALHNAGHTAGLHTLTHADAPEYFDQHGAEAYDAQELRPQLDACRTAGLTPRAFGYPNNRRDERTDAYLSRYFGRFRAGNRDVAEEKIYVPLANLATQRVMHGYGIGEYYHTVEEELLDKLRHAAATNTCVTFFSHDIAEKPSRIGMSVALLERCLQEAEALGMAVACFDELP